MTDGVDNIEQRVDTVRLIRAVSVPNGPMTVDLLKVVYWIVGFR